MAEVTAGHPTEGEGGLAGGSLDGSCGKHSEKAEAASPHINRAARGWLLCLSDAAHTKSPARRGGAKLVRPPNGGLPPVQRPKHQRQTHHLNAEAAELVAQRAGGDARTKKPRQGARRFLTRLAHGVAGRKEQMFGGPQQNARRGRSDQRASAPRSPPPPRSADRCRVSSLPRWRGPDHAHFAHPTARKNCRPCLAVELKFIGRHQRQHLTG